MSRVTIRHASTSDYLDVVQGYEGFMFGSDYLYGLYHELMTDPDFSGVVAVVDEEVVGFYAGHLTDNGQTLYKRAGRVKQAFQGQGIFTSLSKAIDDDVVEGSAVKWEVFSCSKITAQRLSGGFLQRKGFKEILRYDNYVAEIDPCKVSWVEPKSFAGIYEMSKFDFEQLFDDEQVWKRLVPQGRMWERYIPLRQVKENARHLTSERSAAFMSCRVATSHDDTVELPPKVKDAAMISTGAFWEEEERFMYLVNLYAKDYDDLETHILLHLHRVYSVEQKAATFVVAVNSQHNVLIEDRLIRSLEQCRSATLKQEQCFIYEKCFKN